MNKKILAIFVASLFLLIFWRIFFPSNASLEVTPANTTLRIGTNAEYPPFTFIKEGRIVGFDIDLVEEIAKRLGVTINWLDMPFSALLPQLQLGTIDIIAAGISPTPERAHHILFTRPHLTQGNFVVIGKKDKQIPNNLKELIDKNVIVNEGFSADLFLTQAGINARKLPTVADAFLALERDRADFFFTAQTTVQPFFEQYGSENFTIEVIPGLHESVALAVSKKRPELAQQIERVLEQINEDGTLITLKRRWNLED